MGPMNWPIDEPELNLKLFIIFYIAEEILAISSFYAGYSDASISFNNGTDGRNTGGVPSPKMN